MILLTSTSDKIQVITSTAAAIAVHATYIDAPKPLVPGSSYPPDRKNTLISSATTTDVVLSPGASTARNVKFCSVKNTDGALASVVSIIHTDGTTAATLWGGTLQPGDAVQAGDDGKFLATSNVVRDLQIFTATGAVLG